MTRSRFCGSGDLTRCEISLRAARTVALEAAVWGSITVSGLDHKEKAGEGGTWRISC